jgi:hypothetical protein
MFGALCIKVNLDNESLQDRGYFDVALTMIQFLPLVSVAVGDALVVHFGWNDAKAAMTSRQETGEDLNKSSPVSTPFNSSRAIIPLAVEADLSGGKSEVEMGSMNL